MSTTSHATLRIRRRPSTLDPADHAALLADLRHRIAASGSISAALPPFARFFGVGWEEEVPLAALLDEGVDCPWIGYSKKGTGRTYFHAAVYAFLGWVCDDILCLSRIAMDYALTRDGLSTVEQYEYLSVAQRIARYALRLIAGQGSGARNVIHELGHLRIGKSGHFEWKCCMDTAAYGWLCQLRGWLGLPYDEYNAGQTWPPDDKFDDYAGEYINWWEISSCPGEGRLFKMCIVGESGVPGSDTIFCASPCSGSECPESSELRCVPDTDWW